MLDAAFLPAVIRMAEIYFDMEKLLKSFVVLQQEIIVRRRGTHFREAFLDCEERFFKVRDADWENLLDERLPEFPIDHREQDAFPRFPRDNEIEFDVADPATNIRYMRPFFNEVPALELFLPSSLVSPPPFPAQE